jgi:hypothetical protein
MERHLRYGGTFRLILLVDEPIDILHRHHRIEEDEESDDEAHDNLESSYGLLPGQSIGVFASQPKASSRSLNITKSTGSFTDTTYPNGSCRFLGRDGRNLEVMKVFDNLVMGSEDSKLAATKENREKHKVGKIDIHRST